MLPTNWKIRAAQFFTCLIVVGGFLSAGTTPARAEITYTGINSQIYGDDSHGGGQKGPFSLGFPFKLYDTLYSEENAKVNVNINGAITFGAAYWTTWGNSALSAGGEANSILPFWDDLTSYQDNNSAILYATLGSAPNRMFVTQWTNMYFYGTTIQMGTFQAILYEGSNDIQLQYRDLLGGNRALGNDATIGIKKSNAVYHQYSLNTASLTQGQAIRYIHNGTDSYTVNTNAPYEPIYLAPEGAPVSPVLVNPPDGTTGITTTPTFEWLPVEGATSYTVLISTVSNFSSTVVNQSGINGTSYTHGSALNEATQYFWRVQAINEFGSSLSSTRTFTTGTANTNPNTPAGVTSATLVGGQELESLAGSTLTATLTDSDEDEQVRYRLQIASDAGFNSLMIDYRSPFGDEGPVTYTYGESGGTYLVGGSDTVFDPGNYYLRIRTEDDAAGSSAWWAADGVAFTVLADETPPDILDIKTNPNSTSAIIIWETNEPGSSYVEYGLTGAYGLEAAETNTDPRVTNHAMTLSNLKACARYFFRVTSTDANDNPTVSAQKTFFTSGCETETDIDGGSENIIDNNTGGELELNNGQNKVVLNVPSGFASKSTSFQINKLSTNSLTSPEEKSLAGSNVYKLVAVDEDDQPIEEFDEPVTFVIEYGEDVEQAFVEETLGVYKFENGEWVLRDCVLDTQANTLTCTLNNFSIYGVFGESNGESFEENQGGDSGNGSNGNSSSQRETENLCADLEPVSAPDLFQINATSPESAMLYFTPTGGSTDGYIVEYGTTPAANEHAVKFAWTDEGGAVPYEIFELNQQNTTWYFKVRAYSGCAVGPWSQTQSVFVRSQ